MDEDKGEFRKAEKDLRDWLDEMVKVLAPYKQVFDNAEKNNPIDDKTKKKVKSDVENGLDKGIAKSKPKPAPAHAVATHAGATHLATTHDEGERMAAPPSSGHHTHEGVHRGLLEDLSVLKLFEMLEDPLPKLED